MINSSFSLSYSKEKMFPLKLKDSSGELFCVNADFRNILKILRLQEDTDVLEQQRVFLTLRWFYGEEPPLSEFEGIQLLYEFIAGNSSSEEKASTSQFCFEFDAEEIYISFLQDYQLDLYEIPFLHWYKFKMMLSNLSAESAFSQKIQLRFMNLKDYKGESYLKLSRAKRRVQLPIKYTAEEEKLLNEMNAKLR